MKQLLSIIFLLISLQHDAQIMSGLSTSDPGFRNRDVKIKKGESYKKAYINNLPSAVAKDFAARFGEYDVSWYVEDNEVTGYFSDEDVSYVIYYENDRFLKTRSVYNSSRLADRIHNFLEFEMGKTYKINLVTEVRWEDECVYEISLVNNNRICVVKIAVTSGDERLSITEKTFITKV